MRRRDGAGIHLIGDEYSANTNQRATSPTDGATVTFQVLVSGWNPGSHVFSAELRTRLHGQINWSDVVVAQKGSTSVEVWDTTAGPPGMGLVTAVARQTLGRVQA